MKADVSNYDANIAKARRQLAQFKNDNLSISGALRQTQGALLSTAARFASVTAAVGALGAAITNNISIARNFEKSMSQLSSLTGMVGNDLEKLKGYAIELGSSTTLTASEVADAFKMIGSQQPQLLASGEALKAVTKNAITLAEAAGIDLATAAQTLSTSINQMGGDSANAERYINVLAAASQKGAGDIAWLGEAITKSATAAKAVGTDYEELVANLEQLAKAGFDASTAGTALRSIIMNLEKQANQDFKPSVVGLTQAFENLSKANLDLTGYQSIAGKMFATQAKVLAEAAGEARNMTKEITGTNTAEEQAKTNTDNLEGSIKSLSSAWEGFNLHLNSSNGIFRDVVDGLKDIVVWADKTITTLGEVKGNRSSMNNEGSGGPTRVDNQIATLKGVKSPKNRQATYTQQVENYWRFINEWDQKLSEANSRKDFFAWETFKKNNDISTAEANIAGAKSMLREYKQRAQEFLPSTVKSINQKTNVSSGTTDSGTGGKGGKGGKTDPVYAKDSIAYQEKLVSDLTKKWKEAGDAVREGYAKQLGYAQQKLESMKGGFDPTKIKDITGGDSALTKGTSLTIPVRLDIQSPEEKLREEADRLQNLLRNAWSDAERDALRTALDKVNGELDRMTGRKRGTSGSSTEFPQELSKITGGVSSIMGGIQQLGLDVPDGLQKMIALMQGMNTILTGIMALTSIIEVNSTTQAAASVIDAIKPFHFGGVVHAANGFAGKVPGTTYSGDNIPALLDAGEVVLTRAMAGNVASQLEGNNLGNMQLEAVVYAEQLRFLLRNNSKRRGKGEYITSKMRY